LKKIPKMSDNEIEDKGGARSGKDRRIDKFPFEKPEKRTTKNRRSGCDRRARLNYDDKIEIERRSALRDIDQKV
jgi:hypothetical protein